MREMGASAHDARGRARDTPSASGRPEAHDHAISAGPLTSSRSSTSPEKIERTSSRSTTSTGSWTSRAADEIEATTTTRARRSTRTKPSGEGAIAPRTSSGQGRRAGALRGRSAGYSANAVRAAEGRAKAPSISSCRRGQPELSKSALRRQSSAVRRVAQRGRYIRQTERKIQDRSDKGGMPRTAHPQVLEHEISRRG